MSLPCIRSLFDLELVAANWFFTRYFVATRASICHSRHGCPGRQGINKEIMTGNNEFTCEFMRYRLVSDCHHATTVKINSIRMAYRKARTPGSRNV
jgi:hypothetical protein